MKDNRKKLTNKEIKERFNIIAVELQKLNIIFEDYVRFNGNYDEFISQSNKGPKENRNV